MAPSCVKVRDDGIATVGCLQYLRVTANNVPKSAMTLWFVWTKAISGCQHNGQAVSPFMGPLRGTSSIYMTTAVGEHIQTQVKNGCLRAVSVTSTILRRH